MAGRDFGIGWEARTVTEVADRIGNESAPRFPPYPEYSDSGVEWMGKIPAHWEAKALKRPFRVVNGSTPNSGEPDNWGGDIPWVTPEDLGRMNGRVLQEPARYLTRKGYESCGTQMVRAGSLVLSTRAPIGHLALAGTAVCTNQGCRSLVFRHAGDETYFYFQLRAARPVLEAAGRGSTFKELPSEDLESVDLAVPPPEEQRAIASFLDRETAKIDALVARKERLIELLQEKRTALITRAVTRGLDPSVPMKDSGVEWLDEIPAHWKTKRIKRLFRHRKRQGFPERTVLSVYRDYGVIEKSSRNDNFNRTPEDLDTYQLVNPGDLVINKMKAWQGSLGISALSGITSPDYVVYAPDHQENEVFLHHFLRCKLLARVYLTISNEIRPSQWRLEPERFENLIVFLPPPAEQHQIAAFLDDEATKIDALVAKVHQAIDRLKEFRTALISATVTGKIDVRMPGQQ